MKQITFFTLVILILVACGGSASTPAPSTAPPNAPPDSTSALAVLQTYDFTVNGHDVDAALLLFADDATVTTPSGTFSGKSQVRTWLHNDAAQNIHVEVVGDRAVQGDTVKWTERITRDDFKKLGIERAEAHAEAVVQDSKIKSFNLAFTPDTQARLTAAQIAIQPTSVGATPQATLVLSPTLSSIVTPTVAIVITPTAETPTAMATRAPVSAAVVITAAGAISEDIFSAVEQYKQLLGGVDNDGTPGSQPTGYRTITWDGVPDELAAPNNYPSDFFNAPTAPRARGAVLKTPGSALQVSADSNNPTNTPPRFGNINPSYPNIFKTYSAERLFSPIGSNIVDLEFFVPGTNIPAIVRGYGAVYTDVDTDHTAFEYFDAAGNSLGKFGTPISNNGLSFLGVAFPEPVVHRVRIEYGTIALGPDDSATNDVAVMDDFIYGEPQPIPQAQPQATPSATAVVTPTATLSVTEIAGTFVQLGAALNRDKTQAGTDQQITLGSLFAGAEYIPWATWAEKQGNTQQIFVSRFNGASWEPVGASLNIHTNVEAEHPSIDFAGQDRTVPWVAWYEPSPGFNHVKQVFASRFNKDSSLWVPAGQDRGGNEPSLNIHTNQDAEDPVLVGGSANPANPPSPWVCWQEDSAHANAVEIFVSRAVADPSALGGFKWQPVGSNRGGTAADPEPSLNVDFTHSDGEHCWITFAGAGNAVPWVVWAERSGGKSDKVFAAKAVADANAPGGFHWQFVPNCTGADDEEKCTLNVDHSKNASDPFVTAGSLNGGDTTPWMVWTEEGANGKQQVIVEHLDPTTKDKFVQVGGSLNVNPNSNAEGPSITFLGNVPYVAWSEEVGNGARVFVRHLSGDAQTGTWLLDTPQDGLAVNKSLATNYPIIHWAPEGKLDIIWREGDPETEPSQIVVCQSGKVTGLRGPIIEAHTPVRPYRGVGFALPIAQSKAC